MVNLVNNISINLIIKLFFILIFLILTIYLLFLEIKYSDNIDCYYINSNSKLVF